jgi:L-amino acid N-acyltransferase YncA
MMEGLGPREKMVVMTGAEPGEDVLGFGILRLYSWKAGYHHAGETSVFLRPDARGRGKGRQLKQHLVYLARAMDYRHLVARIMADNEASIRYNLRFGYEMVGIQRKIGFVNGRWKDVAILQLNLSDVADVRDLPAQTENSNMEKTFIKEMLTQSRLSTQLAERQLTEAVLANRLNEACASAGFLYRHIGETMHLLATFLGEPTMVRNTTMGFGDEGQGNDLADSRALVESGYALLEAHVDRAPAEEWAADVETPFFGKVSRLRLLTHILLHNAYHAGQLALTIKRGS